MLRRTVIAFALIGTLCGSASAADRGFYVGGGVGLQSISVADFYDDYRPLHFNNKNLGFKLFGGYQILRHLSVEAGYIDYGNRKRWETLRTVGYQEIDVGVEQWDASAVGIFPLGKPAMLFAKVGIASWSTDVKAIEGEEHIDLSSSGTDLAYGLGLEFFVKKFGFRAEYDAIDIPDNGTASLVSINLTYHF
ncbi:MAG: porin family protein [Holophagae bacterium]|jgi:OOP family OmpA-OmpF porin